MLNGWKGVLLDKKVKDCLCDVAYVDTSTAVRFFRALMLSIVSCDGSSLIKIWGACMPADLSQFSRELAKHNKVIRFSNLGVLLE